MSILSGYKKTKKYLKTALGYSLISQWTSSQTVEMGDGATLEAKAADIEAEIGQKADINNPTFTGVPQAPTASTGNNTPQIATTAFVQNAVSNGIAASDAMIIKGTIGTGGTVATLPATYQTGWTYRVVSPGTYAGQVCEIGDLVIALVDRENAGNQDADWCVAQTNIDGAITNVKSGDAYLQTSQSGSAITITHRDVAGTNTTSTTSPSNGGSFTAVDSIARDAKGHITNVNTKTVTLPTFRAENVTAESIGALPIAGGTLTGDLRIKGSGNYGTKINLGDGDYVHLYEPTDDCLEIKAKKVNFLISDTSDSNFTLNGAKIPKKGDLDELKKSVSDGKSAVASAITAMGVSTSSDAAFSTMSSNIRNISKDATAAASDICSGKTAYAGGRKISGTLADLRSAGAVFIGQYFSANGASPFALLSVDHICYSKFGLQYKINTYGWGSISEYAEWGCPHIEITGNGGNINVLRSSWSIDATKYQKMVVQLYGTTKYVGNSMNLRGCIGIASPDASTSIGAEGRDYALRYGDYYFNDSDDHWKDVVVDLSGINQTVVFHMSTVHIGDIYVRTISFVPNH